MSDARPDFGALMQQIRDGSEDATRELVASYGTHVLRVVRRRLNSALRPRFDSQDFVQAVWASFFAFLPEREGFDRPEQLVAFLTELAHNKVVEAVRQRLLGRKHSVNLECPLGLAPGSPACLVAGGQPTPVDIAIAREEWERLRADQPAHYRRMLELLLAGYRHREVAINLGMSEKTVYRVLRKLSPRPADEIA